MLTPDPFSLDKSAVSYVLAYAYVYIVYVGPVECFHWINKGCYACARAYVGPIFTKALLSGSTCIVSSEKLGLLQTLLYMSWT